jgi:hypothetical protein
LQPRARVQEQQQQSCRAIPRLFTGAASMIAVRSTVLSKLHRKDSSSSVGNHAAAGLMQFVTMEQQAKLLISAKQCLDE